MKIRNPIYAKLIHVVNTCLLWLPRNHQNLASNYRKWRRIFRKGLSFVWSLLSCQLPRHFQTGESRWSEFPRWNNTDVLPQLRRKQNSIRMINTIWLHSSIRHHLINYSSYAVRNAQYAHCTAQNQAASSLSCIVKAKYAFIYGHSLQLNMETRIPSQKQM